MPLPLVHVVILNWNGWRDTLECLDSVVASNCAHYRIVVVDNGSTDDSCERIGAWAEGAGGASPRLLVTYDQEEAERGGTPDTEAALARAPAAGHLVLVRSAENLGFAAGCNVGIRYAMAAGAGYVWLLNNDTVVEREALSASVRFLGEHPEYEGLTPQIRLYGERSVIWNCGGRLTSWGSRRYYHAGRDVSEVPRHGFRDITFITGCAPLLRASLIERVGPLSDRFFYGEEDYEFSRRVRRAGLRLACLYDAVIYHKVGRSIDVAARGNDLSSAYIFYLNRFIDLRSEWPPLAWRAWRLGTFCYVLPLLRMRYRAPWASLWALRRTLLRDSERLDRVSKATFERAMRLGFAEAAVERAGG